MVPGLSAQRYLETAELCIVSKTLNTPKWSDSSRKFYRKRSRSTMLNLASTPVHGTFLDLMLLHVPQSQTWIVTRHRPLSQHSHALPGPPHAERESRVPLVA